MARINTSLQGGASLPADASSSSSGAKRSRTDTDDSRPSKRSRNSTKTKGKKIAEKGENAGSSPSSEPRRSTRDRNSGDGTNWWQATGGAESDSQKERGAYRSPLSAKSKAKSTKSAQTPIKVEKARPGKEKPGKAKPEMAISKEATPQSQKPRRSRKSDASSTRVDKPATKSPAPRPSGKKSSKRSRPSQVPVSASPQSQPKTKAKSRATAKRQQGNGQGPAEGSSTREVDDLTRAEELEGEDDSDEEEEEEGHWRRQTAIADGDQPDQPFRQLVPRTRLIRMSTMTSKWAPLDSGAISAVQAILADCARPVISRLMRSVITRGEGPAQGRRQQQAWQAIAGVTKRLRSKLVKGIPFPPATVHAAGSSRSTRSKRKGGPGESGSGVESDFNYEKAVEATQALEQQLTPLQHAIALLERERKREEDALEADYATLRELETNAQAEMRSWRERARKAHVLAPADAEDNSDITASKVMELVERTSDGDEKESLFENLPMATQLGNHMDSLRGNLQQIDGVVPAIVRSKAALQHVLHQRLESHQYERILLG